MSLRDDAINKLLEPINWDWSSSIRSRQNWVSERHSQVRRAYPLMLDEEKARADQWFKDEAHSGLWD